MKITHCKGILILILILIPFTYAFSQELTIGTPERGKYEGEKDKARVDFISTSADLVIVENNGEFVEQPVRTPDGKYRYTCICDVIDNNLFGFNISIMGGTQKEFVKVYIEEGALCTYPVDVPELPYTIGDVKINNMFQVIPKEKTAAITISTNYKGLSIRSVTGEQAQPPVMNEATSLFEFVIYFDLSEEGSEQITRKLIFSVGNKEEMPYEIGALSPKQGVDMAVIVVQESSCYESQITLAKNSFINGLYQQAYQSYTSAFQCKDAPAEKPAVEEKNQRNMQILYVALNKAMKSYEKAEAFRQRNMLDSSMVYHQEAYKLRLGILKANPSDPYCLEYQRKYDQVKREFPRIVSGEILNSIRLDAGGKNLPIPDAHVVLTLYKIKTRKVNNIEVEELEKSPVENSTVTLGTTDKDGVFRVTVPRNPAGHKYVLAFGTADNFTGKNPFRFGKDLGANTYIPSDADLQENITIIVAPRISTINSNKK